MLQIYICCIFHIHLVPLSPPPRRGCRVLLSPRVPCVQIEIRLCRVVRRASEVLTSHQLDLVRSSGFCDFLVVEKLGCGMARGRYTFNTTIKKPSFSQIALLIQSNEIFDLQSFSLFKPTWATKLIK